MAALRVCATVGSSWTWCDRVAYAARLLFVGHSPRISRRQAAVLVHEGSRLTGRCAQANEAVPGTNAPGSIRASRSGGLRANVRASPERPALPRQQSARMPLPARRIRSSSWAASATASMPGDCAGCRHFQRGGAEVNDCGVASELRLQPRAPDHRRRRTLNLRSGSVVPSTSVTVRGVPSRSASSTGYSATVK